MLSSHRGPMSAFLASRRPSSSPNGPCTESNSRSLRLSIRLTRCVRSQSPGGSVRGSASRSNGSPNWSIYTSGRPRTKRRASSHSAQLRAGPCPLMRAPPRQWISLWESHSRRGKSSPVRPASTRLPGSTSTATVRRGQTSGSARSGMSLIPPSKHSAPTLSSVRPQRSSTCRSGTRVSLPPCARCLLHTLTASSCRAVHGRIGLEGL